ncbi:MAG: nucleotidyltransferase family protein [Bacteroidales bacterium]|nr:nucleotidyltransferase family protein [Bacteroidales bacterium]
MKAMIFAAGLGTRLKAMTENRPKALVECNGRTLLEFAILKLKYFGFSEIIVNVHHFSSQIIDFVASHDYGIPVRISDETNQLLDTGGGLLFAKSLLQDSDPFLVCNVDIISSIDFNKMIEFHKQKNALVTLAVSDRKTSRYLLFDKNHQLCAWENRKTQEKKVVRESLEYIPLAFSGIQIISPKIFDYISESGKFAIMDLYLRLAAEHSIIAYDHTGDFWLDVGKFEEFESIENQVKNRKFEYLE